MPAHASLFYSRNVTNFVQLLVKEGRLAPDFTDEILDNSAVVVAGSVHHEPTRIALEEPQP
jgi:NAD(P) transhydrogenase subunit alpha